MLQASGKEKGDSVTLRFSLASRLSTETFHIQSAILIDKLSDIHGDDQSFDYYLSVFLPFMRHQYGHHCLNRFQIQRIMELFMGRIMIQAREKKYPLNCYYAFKMILLWVVNDFVVVEDDPAFDPIGSFEFTDFLQTLGTESCYQTINSFEASVEAIFIKNLLYLILHRKLLALIQADVKIMKLIIKEKKDHHNHPKPESFYKSYTTKIIAHAKKIDLNQNIICFADTMILYSLYMECYSDKPFMFHVLSWMKCRMSIDGIFACYACDILKEYILHPAPMKYQRYVYDDANAAVTIMTLLEYSRVNPSFFGIMKKEYHNWWIRYKAFEALLLVMNDIDRISWHEAAITGVNKVLVSENKHECKALLSQRKEGAFIHVLQAKWFILPVSLEFDEDITYRRCDLNTSFYVLLSSVADYLSRRELIEFAIHHISDSLDNTANKYADLLLSHACDDDCEAVLEMLPELMFLYFQQHHYFPALFLEKLLSYLLRKHHTAAAVASCTSHDSEEHKSFIDEIFHITLQHYRDNHDDMLIFLDMIEKYITIYQHQHHKDILDVLHRLVFNHSKPGDNRTMARCLMHRKLLKSWMYASSILPSEDADVISYIASSLNLPIAAMMIIQGSGHMHDMTFIGAISAYCYHLHHIDDHDADRIILRKSQQVILSIAASCYDHVLSSLDIYFRLIQLLINKYQDGDVCIIMSCISSTITSSPNHHITLSHHINIWLELILAYENISIGCKSTASELARVISSAPSYDAIIPTLTFDFIYVIFDLRYPDKYTSLPSSFDAMMQAFINVPHHALSSDEMMTCMKMYHRIRYISAKEHIRDMTHDMLHLHFASSYHHPVDDDIVDDERVSRCFAAIMHAVYLCHGFYPTCHHIITALALLYTPAARKGRLAMIPIEEGRHIILLMIASYLSLHSHTVHIISSHPVTDAEAMLAFYKLLGVSVGCAGDDKQLSSQQLSCMVVYGTTSQLEHVAMMRNYHHHHTNLHHGDDRRREVVMVDDVASMMLCKPSAASRMYEGTEIFHSIAWMYKLLIDAYRDLNHHRGDDDSNVSTMMKAALISSAAYTSSSQRIQRFIISCSDYMISCAIKAMMMLRDDHYRITDNRIIINHHLSSSSSSSSSSLSSSLGLCGLQQMLSCKEGLQLIPDRFLSGEISRQGCINRYHCIYGIIVQDDASHDDDHHLYDEEMMHAYDVDTIIMPSYHAKHRIDHETIIMQDNVSWYQAIADDAMSMIVANRPCLIVFPTRDDIFAFQPHLSSSSAHMMVQLLCDDHEVPDKDMMNSITSSNMITIMLCSLALRLNLSPPSSSSSSPLGMNDAGALHVIIADYPSSSSQEMMMRSKASSSSSSSSSRMILNHRRLSSYHCHHHHDAVALDKQRLDARRASSMLRQSIIRSTVYAAVALYRDEMIRDFYKRYKQWHDIYLPPPSSSSSSPLISSSSSSSPSTMLSSYYRLRAVQRQWQEFLTISSYRTDMIIDRINDDDDDDEAIINIEVSLSTIISQSKHDYLTMMDRISSSLHNNSIIIDDPSILYDQAMHMMKTSISPQIIYDLQHILTVDEYYAKAYLALARAYDLLRDEENAGKCWQYAKDMAHHNLSSCEMNIYELAVLVIAYKHLQQHAEASQYLSQIRGMMKLWAMASSDVGGYDSIIIIADMLYDYGSYNETISLCELIAEIWPHHTRSYILRGYAMIGTHAYQDAINSFEQASKISHQIDAVSKYEDSAYHKDLSQAYAMWAKKIVLEENRYHEGNRYANMAVKHDDRNHVAYFILGRCEERLRMPRMEALQSYRRALELCPCELYQDELNRFTQS